MDVYCEGKNRPLDEALEIITDDWIDNGNCCEQTTIDLADACRKFKRLFDAFDNDEHICINKLDGRWELTFFHGRPTLFTDKNLIRLLETYAKISPSLELKRPSPEADEHSNHGLM